MSIYRVKQFLWAITAPFKRIDDDILARYLNSEELKLFKKLKISEQHHCIRVCKDALIESSNWREVDKNKLARIALLHDIGKIDGRLNVVDKSLIVICDKITSGNLRKYTNIKKIDVYYNHPKKSSDLLKKIDEYDEEFLEAIEKHHHSYNYRNNYRNNYLTIIKKCDDNN